MIAIDIAEMAVPDTITIDGPAGAGKSTVGELLARRLGYLYFDTGTMYRALTWAALRRGVDPTDGLATAALAHALDIQVLAPTVADGRQYTVLVDGQDATTELRLPEVEQQVSRAASYPEVREAMRAQQRAIGRRGRVVMVGRDIGNIVMPDAPLKIYLEATLAERARRRGAELRARGRDASLAEVQAEIARRDALDQHVMAPAPDAVVIHSDGLVPSDVVEAILGVASRVT
jgi:CMP/dCMP kinase